MDIKERIDQLGCEFDDGSDRILNLRVQILRELVEEHGYDLVCQATGYRHTTLANIVSGHVKSVSENKVNRATYIFNNLKSE